MSTADGACRYDDACRCDDAYRYDAHGHDDACRCDGPRPDDPAYAAAFTR